MQFEINGHDKKGPIKLRFEVKNQFDIINGVWLKGNLHCHVNAMGNAQEVCKHYRGLGFDFLASTDYETVTALPKSTEEFITLPGAEKRSLAHITFIGIQDDICSLKVDTLELLTAAIKEAESRGGLAILAHPYWSGFDWNRLCEIARTGVTGFEISNRICWRINGKERSEVLWHMLIDAGITLAPIGVDDSHGFNKQITGRTWTGVIANERTRAGVLEAIRAHRTYASEGPILKSIRVRDDGMLAVESSPCLACHFMSRAGGASSVVDDVESERFELDLAKYGYRIHDWISVCLEDKCGRRAWSAAIPFNAEVISMEGNTGHQIRTNTQKETERSPGNNG